MAEIQLSGVSMVYPNGTQALKQVDLTVPDHEFIVLLGPSGCGKSTLLRLIAGLEKPTEGTLRFDGEDVYTTAESERLVRLPMYYGLTEDDQNKVIAKVLEFYEK